MNVFAMNVKPDGWGSTVRKQTRKAPSLVQPKDTKCSLVPAMERYFVVDGFLEANPGDGLEIVSQLGGGATTRVIVRIQVTKGPVRPSLRCLVFGRLFVWWK